LAAKQEVLHGARATKKLICQMNADGPSCSDLPISGGPGMNPSRDGSDEQVFGAKQQLLHGAKGD
jgi:hypothetical protein